MDNSQYCKKYDIGINNFRFANIFQLNNASIDNIQSAVKTVKSRTPLDMSCEYPGNRMLKGDVMLSQVKAVEQKLQIESSEHINYTLKTEELKTAGELFLYLNNCPKQFSIWLTSWRLFYEDLFLTQPADQIILTLNRMMKTKIPQDKDVKVRAEKLLKKSTSLLSLKYDRIKSLIPAKISRNGSAVNDLMVPKGTHFPFNSRFREFHHQPSCSYLNPREDNIFFCLHTIL